jgi:ferredoxin
LGTGRSRAIGRTLYAVILKLWPLGKLLDRLGNAPLVGPLFRGRFGGDENASVIIPVHEVVSSAESIVLPYSLLTPLVERATVRFLMDHCLCRKGENCQTYPQEVGCLFLGDAAAEIDPSMGAIVSVGAALAHMEHAMSLGLVPLVAHNAFDAWLLGIPYHRMLTICFCCDCCCSIRQSLRHGPPAFWETVTRVPGLTVQVGAGCVGCGTCAGVCPVRAITIRDGRACIAEVCKGCGRCIDTCPNAAITLYLDEEADPLGHLLAEIESRTEIFNE